jgi:threonine aldolase
VQTRTTQAADGRLALTDLHRMVRPQPSGADSSGVRTTALVVEQTHNQSGGRIYPLADLAELRAFASSRALAVHCDGARIWNAHVASGVPLAQYGALFDSLAVCLSKGLGCPAGAVVLLADEAKADAARRVGSL